MSLAILLAPLVLILPAAQQSSPDHVQAAPAQLEQQPENWAIETTTFEAMTESFRVPGAMQVRIQQQSTIRISPRPMPLRPNLLAEETRVPRIVERKIGRCLPADRLAGVQVESGNRLLLYLRDRRVIRAELERSCRARDYYSGFYLSANEDGNLCVGRDTLLSRSGANCRLTRIRQLVQK